MLSDAHGGCLDGAGARHRSPLCSFRSQSCGRNHGCFHTFPIISLQAWVLKHHVIKHGLLGTSLVYFNDFPFEMPIYWISQPATFNVDHTPSLRVSRSFFDSSICRACHVQTGHGVKRIVRRFNVFWQAWRCGTENWLSVFFMQLGIFGSPKLDSNMDGITGTILHWDPIASTFAQLFPHLDTQHGSHQVSQDWPWIARSFASRWLWVDVIPSKWENGSMQLAMCQSKQKYQKCFHTMQIDGSITNWCSQTHAMQILLVWHFWQHPLPENPHTPARSPAVNPK